MKHVIDREELDRAQWASRRGVLELDLLLSPFVTKAFPKLNSHMRAQYMDMLKLDDQDLLVQIMYSGKTPRYKHSQIVLEIRRFHRLVDF